MWRSPKGVVQKKGLTDEKAARMLEGFRAGGSSLRPHHVSSTKFKAYCDAHPTYAAEVIPLLAANRKAADKRKGAGRSERQTCKRGHSLVDAYIHVSPEGWVMRNCRTCHQLRINNIKPLDPAKLLQVKTMLLAKKSVAEIIGQHLRGKKRPVIVNSTLFYNARKADPSFDRFVKQQIAESNSRAQKLRWSILRAREATQQQRDEANDYHAIRAMIPRAIPDPDEIVSRIFEEILSGNLARADVAKRVQFYVKERERLFPTKYRKFGDSLLLSLDEQLFDDGAATRLDTVSRGLWD
ncbi:hypothetical protein [Bradyrhizobium sp. 6(2017)]|uniref:hypothetical protein n=1 Tax=Bradyrhizobium sp. 6(2017) TaxID=1197460 RepID=UPI0013E110A3|nr:hypothetical protein [Bradyrhizobium sp. 6(2017)]QIG91984.1 hypothetical protein G6P99_05350 [Bradyrhizobium sp. 6(2017)]